jgi:hypothetical protein
MVIMMFEGWEKVWGEIGTLVLVVALGIFMCYTIYNQPTYITNKVIYETKLNECMSKFSKDSKDISEMFAQCESYALFLAKEEVTK